MAFVRRRGNCPTRHSDRSGKTDRNDVSVWRGGLRTVGGSTVPEGPTRRRVPSRVPLSSVRGKGPFVVRWGPEELLRRWDGSPFLERTGPPSPTSHLSTQERGPIKRVHGVCAPKKVVGFWLRNLFASGHRLRNGKGWKTTSRKGFTGSFDCCTPSP